MDDKKEVLRGIKDCLKQFNTESGDDLSDLVNGAIVGFALAEGIVSGEIDTSGKSAEENALGIIAAITLLEALPNSTLDSIGKMFS